MNIREVSNFLKGFELTRLNHGNNSISEVFNKDREEQMLPLRNNKANIKRSMELVNAEEIADCNALRALSAGSEATNLRDIYLIYVKKTFN